MAGDESGWIPLNTLEKYAMNEYSLILKKYIKSSQLLLAKELLKDLSVKPLPVKLDVLETLALAPDKIALALLDFLVRQQPYDPEITERLFQLVTDRAHLNFQYAVILYKCADREKIRQASPLLRHILSNETQPDILIATIETIGREKIETLMDEVAEFIFYDDPLLKAKAVRALERIGTKKALEKLEQAAGTEKCDQDILDAIEYLKLNTHRLYEIPPGRVAGESEAEDDLVIALASPDLDIRFNAFTMLSKIKDRSFSVLGPLLKSDSHDLVVLCLEIFSRTLPRESILHGFSMLDDKTADPGVRFAACQMLGSFSELDSAAALVRVALDPSTPLRMAAVNALDRNMTDFVAAEIKKKIESGTKSAAMLAETILDVEAVNIMGSLLGSDTFSYMASNYFSKPVADSVIESYILALEKRKLKVTVRKYRDIAGENRNRSLPRIAVVSDSGLILKVHSKLIAASGFRPMFFQSPQAAFEAILDQKPDVLITDLFLNGMTGLDFAGEIRDIYSPEDLPVVVSSLQKELIAVLADEKKKNMAVHAWYGFPLKSSQIKSFVKG